MKYTKKFLKYTVLGLLFIIMLVSFVIGVACALAGIVGLCMTGNVQHLLLVPVALFYAFMGFVALDCACAFADKWLTE